MKQPRCYIITHQTSRVVGDCIDSLTRYGWDFEKFDAIDGQIVNQSHWDQIGIQVSQDGKLKDRPGAQGCWLSHHALWTRCKKLQEPIVVFEHDAVIMSSWPETLDISSKIVKLYKTAETKHNPLFGYWSKGSHAYTLTPLQAEMLISYAQEHGAQAVDKHFGDQVVPWSFLNEDLVTLNSRRGASTTSPMRRRLNKI